MVGSVGGSNDNFSISGMGINGTAVGEAVTTSDGAMHAIMGVSTSGHLGPAHFSGTFADYSGSTITTGTGTASATVGTLGSFTLGAFGSYAACYDVTQ